MFKQKLQKGGCEMNRQRENKVSSSIRFAQVYAPKKLLTPDFFPMIVLLFPYFWTLPFITFTVAPNMFSVEVRCLSPSMQISPEFIRSHEYIRSHLWKEMGDHARLPLWFPCTQLPFFISHIKFLVSFILETFLYKVAMGKKCNPEIIAQWC